jgi:oligopeptide transport system ATP-binding protein
MPLLEVSELEVRFDTPEGVVKAVNGMSFEVAEGETLAIVGESGSGKSQLVMAVMGLLAENGSASGSARFHGQELMTMTAKELNAIRGRHIAMIFQDPMTSLNPYLTIEKQMVEVVMHHQGLSRDEARAHAVEMLRAVRIPDPEERIRQYPHEYSGGIADRRRAEYGPRRHDPGPDHRVGRAAAQADADGHHPDYPRSRRSGRDQRSHHRHVCG